MHGAVSFHTRGRALAQVEYLLNLLTFVFEGREEAEHDEALVRGQKPIDSRSKHVTNGNVYTKNGALELLLLEVFASRLPSAGNSGNPLFLLFLSDVGPVSSPFLNSFLSLFRGACPSAIRSVLLL